MSNLNKPNFLRANLGLYIIRGLMDLPIEKQLQIAVRSIKWTETVFTNTQCSD